MIDLERDRQDQKFGDAVERGCNWVEWFTILGEEVGEVGQECIRNHFEKKDNEAELIAELIQVAAVAVAMLEVAIKE